MRPVGVVCLGSWADQPNLRKLRKLVLGSIVVVGLPRLCLGSRDYTHLKGSGVIKLTGGVSFSDPLTGLYRFFRVIISGGLKICYFSRLFWLFRFMAS